MTSIRLQERDEMPTEVNDHTTVSVQLVVTLIGAFVGAVIWVTSMQMTVVGVQKDQENVRDRLLRIEKSLERVEVKLDAIRDQR